MSINEALSQKFYLYIFHFGLVNDGLISHICLSYSISLKQIVFALNYNKTNNNNNRFRVNNFNNENSIDSYFLSNSENLRLDHISAYDDESISQAYAEIGSYFGYAHQQAFLGYYSYIIEPNEYVDDNTLYSSNIPAGSFSQSFGSFNRGNNGVFSVNLGIQYDKNLFLGINLNSHVIDRENVYLFNESNENFELVELVRRTN